MKKIIIVLTALMIMSLFVVSGTQAAAEKTYKWKMSQPYPSGTMLFNITEAFIERVDKASNGRIKITHYPGDLLGDYMVQQEAVGSGAQELAITWPGTAMNPKWDILGMGYVGWNSDHGKAAFGPGGWMLPVLDDIAAECNWKILSIFPSGSTTGGDCVISNDSFDPVNPEGRKLRVQASQNYTIRYAAMGFNPVTMPMSEVSSALALGTIDASAGCVPTEFAIYGDAFSYAYIYAPVLFPAELILTRTVWDSLSEADQKLLLEAADFTTDANFGWQAWEIDAVRNYEEDLLPWQILVTLDGDQWATMAEKARAAEWPYLEKLIGTELMDTIKANAVELPWGLTLDEMNYGFGKVLTTEWLTERQGGVFTKNPPPVKK